MKIEIVSLASSNEKWFLEAIESYAKKLSYISDFNLVHLKPNKGNRKAAADKKSLDSETLLNYLKPTDFVIICDENGKTFSSISFSKKLESVFSAGHKRVLFLIGGPYGFTEELKKKANLLFSLSPLTFNHWLAEVVVAEQIYRALSIQKNLPYHNE
jgi:23S rRNA (pseudouridine1915-N3)-methyltransferase